MISYRAHYLADKIATLSQKPAPAPSSTDESKTAEKPAAAPSEPQLKLLDAGAQPRTVLRLHPKPGEKQSLEMTVKISMGTKLGEMQTPVMKIPTMKMAMNATVQSISPEGDITYQIMMGDTSVEEEPGTMPQIVEAMKSALGGVKGLSGTGKISSRGFIQGTEVKLPANTDPQLRQAMDQMKDSFSQLSCPLPEEAVGPAPGGRSGSPSNPRE